MGYLLDAHVAMLSNSRLVRGVVLSLRDSGPCRGLWHIPGGTVRFGEPLTDAVRRVAESELGLEVVVGRFLGYIEYPSHLHVSFDWPVGMAFVAQLTASPPPPMAPAFVGETTPSSTPSTSYTTSVALSTTDINPPGGKSTTGTTTGSEATTPETTQQPRAPTTTRTRTGPRLNETRTLYPLPPRN
jgi:ADP-ribose pyrophosphatase YjhB (NUDIX family)